MAIGTAAAIGLGVAGVGSALAGRSANKAAGKAADVSAENNAQNVALQSRIYDQNTQLLSPFVQRGNAAGDTINALLGLGGTQQQPAQQPQVNALYNGGYGTAAQYQGAGGQPFMGSPAFAARYGIATGVGPMYWQDGGPGFAGPNMATTGATGTATGAPPNVDPTQAANNAFDIFRNSTGYQFRLGEGQNALNSGYAASGALQSGDALRALTEYGQNFASNEFGKYMGYLGNQQGVGLSAGSAVAGVGQNYANNVTNMNTQDAANQANALLSRQNPLANAAGMLGGGLFQYGMR